MCWIFWVLYTIPELKDLKCWKSVPKGLTQQAAKSTQNIEIKISLHPDPTHKLTLLYKVWVVDLLEFIDLLTRHSSSSSSSLQQAQQASKLLCNKIVDFLFRGSEQILPGYLSYPTTDCMFLDYIFWWHVFWLHFLMACFVIAYFDGTVFDCIFCWHGFWLHVLLAWFLIACFDPMVSWLHFLITWFFGNSFFGPVYGSGCFVFLGLTKFEPLVGLGVFFFCLEHIFGVFQLDWFPNPCQKMDNFSFRGFHGKWVALSVGFCSWVLQVVSSAHLWFLSNICSFWCCVIIVSCEFSALSTPQVCCIFFLLLWSKTSLLVVSKLQWFCGSFDPSSQNKVHTLWCCHSPLKIAISCYKRLQLGMTKHTLWRFAITARKDCSLEL